MKNNPKPSYFESLILIAHGIFISGMTLLLIYAEQANQPIHIEQPELINIILLYAAGYLIVFTKWLTVIKNNKPYYGKAEDAPKYLTHELWGGFPYLGIFGWSKKIVQQQFIKTAHSYQDKDVLGMTFSQLFCLHVNKTYLLISLLIVALLPYMFLNQEAPSYLKFVYYSPTIFTIYISFFILVWLSALAIITLRVLLLIRKLG